jgi:hypothetical protein
VPTGATDTSGVRSAPWTRVLGIEEPKLSTRGSVLGARVTIFTVEEALTGMTPTSARELAAALAAAADQADALDEATLPHLQAFADAVSRFSSFDEDA